MNSAMEPANLLLVDDLEENLTSLEALLRREGVRCLKARSGEEALELLLTHDVALALLDVQMPGMDGFQLAEFMRGAERARHVPIIFVTAGVADGARRFRGYEAGAVDFIQKPIEADVLRSKAAVFLDLHCQRQQIAAQRDALAAQAETLKTFEQLTRNQLVLEQETARLREQFIAVLGHDLRNPLAAIAGAAHLLRRQPQSDKALHTIKLMEASVERMAGLIDDVMDFARARLGAGIVLNRAPLRVEPILRQVVEELEAGHPGRRILCDFAVPEPVDLDGGRIGQMVSNLLANALAYGDPEQPIVLRSSLEEDAFILSVTNAGPTIPDAVMERLFRPFFRGEAESHQQGLGLGLHIAGEIATAHGGRLSAQSADGRTTFTFTMPLEAAVTPS
jgi:two-component system, sensor histidine kinase and response regulator